MEEALAQLHAKKENLDNNNNNNHSQTLEQEEPKPHIPHNHELDDDEEQDESFDYLAYAQDRAFFFWGDLLELDLVREDELPDTVVKRAKRLKY